MTPVDWIVVVLYAAALVGVGLAQRRRSAATAEAYFASGRSLPWYLAGTSMIAASFATDTPLLVSGIVRQKGIWGNWVWWGLGFSTILSAFLFARLWRRSGVLTEPELTETRYGGAAAGALRGIKAVYWGGLYNCFAAGAVGVLGLSKVAEVALGWSRLEAIGLCAALALAYAVVSGFWGVVATDALQFCAALAGSAALAVCSVRAAGGWDAVLAAAGPGRLAFVPDLAVPAGTSFWESDLSWMLAFALVQGWAWKNTDGGGMLVQRIVSCRDERESSLAMLWFNAAHYALRAWPWIVVGLASLAVIPEISDPEKAYPRLIVQVLPAGLRGFVLAWFLAEFVASLAGSMNWGASLLVNDLYARFVKRDGTEAHYVAAGRAASVAILLGAVAWALAADSVVRSFKTILQVTAGIGVVQIARWLWWRVNAWSEISAFAVSIPLYLAAGRAARAFGVPEGSDLFNVLWVALASAVVWVPATFLAPAEARPRLRAFRLKVRPPGPGWGAVEAGVVPPLKREPLGPYLLQWALGTCMIFSANFAIGAALTRRPVLAMALGGASALSALLLLLRLGRDAKAARPTGRGGPGS